jgi:flagellar hook protein FlgE
MNLPAGAAGLLPANFNPADAATYSESTSITIYDSLGDSHVQTFYFIKDGTSATNDWLVASAIDGNMIDFQNGDGTNVTPPAANAVGTASNINGVNGFAAGRLTFSASGDFTGISGGDNNPITIPTANVLRTAQLGGIITNGADTTQQLSLNFNLDPLGGQSDNEPTQFASNFEVTSLEQDGLPVGRLTGIDIGPDGLVRATFSNGTSEPISRIALARFSNEQGLTQDGNASWKESILSGESLAGEATTGTFGTINSSSLEQSNVNLTTELIDMIIAQRNFQANSRALEINNALNQTILGIR